MHHLRPTPQRCSSCSTATLRCRTWLASNISFVGFLDHSNSSSRPFRYSNRQNSLPRHPRVTRVVVRFDLPDKLRGLIAGLCFCHFFHLLHHDAFSPSGVSFGLMQSIHLGTGRKLILEKCCDIHLLVVPSRTLLLHEVRRCQLGLLRATTSNLGCSGATPLCRRVPQKGVQRS